MSTKESSRRDSYRHRCRGEVTIQRLCGGPAFTARLVDVGGGGARLCIDQPLPVGETLRLVFPMQPDQGRQGRTIQARVAHSSLGPSGCTIGVEFGGAATVIRGKALQDAPPIRHMFGLIVRIFSRKPSRKFLGV